MVFVVKALIREGDKICPDIDVWSLQPSNLVQLWMGHEFLLGNGLLELEFQKLLSW